MVPRKSIKYKAKLNELAKRKPLLIVLLATYTTQTDAKQRA